MNNKIPCLLLLLFFSGQKNMSAQEIDPNIQTRIRETIEHFFRYIDNKTEPYVIEEHFGDRSHFIFNGNDFEGMQGYLENYNKLILNNKEHTHSINKENYGKIKCEDKKNEIYTISCIVHRTIKSLGNNYLVNGHTDDIEMDFKLKYYRPQTDKMEDKVIILEMAYKEPIKLKKFPISIKSIPNLLISYGKNDKIDKIHVGLKENEKVFTVNSSYIKRTVYTDGTTEDSKPMIADFRVASNDLSYNIIDRNRIRVRIPKQVLKNKSTHYIRVIQDKIPNPLQRTISIIQSFDEGKRIFAPHYSPRNKMFGLSYLSNWSEENQFLLGFLLQSNMNMFHSTHHNNKEISPTVKTSYVNGYEITQSFYDHSTTHYYPEIDYPGNYQIKNKSLEGLINGGYSINNYLIAELGIGLAYSQDFYDLKKDYDINVISYTPKKENLPDIETIYDYSIAKAGKGNKYAKSDNWACASRVGIRGLLPLTEDFYLGAGVGYTYTFPSIRDLNSIDFSISFGLLLF